MPANTPTDTDQHPPLYTHQELMNFFNAMDEVFFSYDAVNLKVIQVSKGCEKIYGRTVEELLSNHRLWYDAMHPDDKHIVTDEIKALQRGEQVIARYRLIRPDGSVRWVEKKIIPTLDASGKLVRTDGTTRDITDIKEAEEKQRKDEAIYRQIVESAQEGIWTIDENNKTNFVNKKLCEMLGYTAEEMLGKELFDLMDAEGKLYAMACMERRRKGAKENLNIRYVTKSGADLWANISANPIFDEDGKYTGSLAMVTDITQKMLDEEALKKSEANLRTIFDHTDTAYVLFDDDLRIVSFNALAQKYSEDQNNRTLHVDHLIQEYFAPERWWFILELIETVKRDGIADYEITYTKADGTVKRHNVRWLIVRNNEGDNCGFILANKDITEAKLAALEREHITADLIKHNKDLEQFTYIVSHNLRAPVANIMGLAELLVEFDDDPVTRRELLERVIASIKHVDEVISDLNFILQARRSSNEQKQVVHFKNLCNDIKESIFNTITKEQVQIECLFDDATSIYTIRSYMYSIIYNLVINSIKYRKPGLTPLITITTKKIDDKVELSFTDNGKGIDMERNGAHIFGLYKRFDHSVEGKGMGLFMVKTQVEALGGTIWINSKLGEGTEFVMRFSA